MAWETRGGRRYYYRKVWKEGRCFSVYEGGGIGGQFAAAHAEAERAERAQAARTWRAEAARFDAIDARIENSWAVVSAAVERELEAAGYHRHKRQWRLKRNEQKAG